MKKNSEESYITVVDVRDYALCPKIIYFTKVIHLRERITEAMIFGREFHEEPPLAPIIPKLKPKQILKNLQLISHKLRLIGKADYIIITKHGEYIPVDVKWSDPEKGDKPQRHHKIQLTAYAMLIEENFKTTVKRALIYYSRAGKLIEFKISNHEKREVKSIINRIYEAIRSEEPPKVKPNPKKCMNCGYQKYCQPRSERRREVEVLK